MTHYVGPRANHAAPAGDRLCPRCQGRGFLRHGASGRVLHRSDYGLTAFWRTCSKCQGTGHIAAVAQAV